MARAKNIPDFFTRFYSKIKPLENGCWMWSGCLAKTGYGQFHIRDGLTGLSHRIAWELHHRREIPDGLCLDHLCRVRSCVNPEHLELVTHRTNILRGTGASARVAKLTHCQRGHAFDLFNTYIRPKSGKRMCMECLKARNARYYASRT